MGAWRIAFGVAGGLLGLYGVVRLLVLATGSDLLLLGIWMVTALLVHDAVLSPTIVGVGWLLRRMVPDRARRYVQAGLLVGALVAVIALPLIYRQDSQPASKAMLQQPYVGNLALLVGFIAGFAVLAYAVRVIRDRTPRSTSGPPTHPPTD